MKKACFLIARVITDIALGIGLLWALGLCIYQPWCLCVVFAILSTCALYRIRKHHFGNVRYWLWGLLVCSIISYHLLPNPAPARWQTSWAREPQFLISGNILTISNLRDFHYRSETDFDPKYRTEHYNLSNITEVNFAECHWDGMEAICHTMISFGFADGKRFVISAETRLPEGEKQSGLGGLYKRYGLLYIFGTEEDIFALRTNHRHEDLFLFPMKLKPGRGRELLENFIRIAQETHTTKKPYNTISANCSSGVMQSFRALAPRMPKIYDLAPIHNGSISRLLHKHGAFFTRPGESYDELRSRCYLGYDIIPVPPMKYSQAIRQRHLHCTSASPQNNTCQP